jgi:hypothetical protein
MKSQRKTNRCGKFDGRTGGRADRPRFRLKEGKKFRYQKFRAAQHERKTCEHKDKHQLMHMCTRGLTYTHTHTHTHTHTQTDTHARVRPPAPARGRVGGESVSGRGVQGKTEGKRASTKPVRKETNA